MKRVEAQAKYPENQLWEESRVAFAAIHGVGSNNNYAPGPCYPVGSPGCVAGIEDETAAQAATRVAEADARSAANVSWLRHTFDLAEQQGPVNRGLLS